MERESDPIRVETMPGVICSRFARPIGSVGLYVYVLALIRSTEREVADSLFELSETVPVEPLSFLGEPLLHLFTRKIANVSRR